MIRPSMAVSALLVMLAVMPVFPADAGRTADLETQTNREGSVTVKVTPRNVSPGDKSWDFEIVLETHTVALDQDMTHAAALVDGSGNSQQPVAWEGDPAGGHHRKGVLRFQSPVRSPEFLELRISGIGGVSQRVFRWRLPGGSASAH